jgi:GT2 family glycosyltransferase
MANTPDERVSVVVITHDRCAELHRTLDLLAALPEQPAVVVVDNASTDGTAAMVRSRHPDVTLLTPGENLGAVGRNLGVQQTNTPYVAFCDDDTWYDPGALSRAADILDAHPTLAVVTAAIMVPGHPLLSFLAGVSIVRREAFLAAGGFSTRLWLGGEEELLASDIVRAGWHMTYVPEVVAHHHASRLRDPHLRRRHGIRNTLWFTWLRRPLPSAALLTVRLLQRLPRDRVTARGVGDALRGLPWVVRERKPVPAHMERGYRLLEDMQLNGGARKYVS